MLSERTDRRTNTLLVRIRVRERRVVCLPLVQMKICRLIVRDFQLRDICRLVSIEQHRTCVITLLIARERDTLDVHDRFITKRLLEVLGNIEMRSLRRLCKVLIHGVSLSEPNGVSQTNVLLRATRIGRTHSCIKRPEEFAYDRHLYFFEKKI
jgi:hypothetical protein